MQEAQDRRQMLDLTTALKLLDQLVKEAPDWAEAWNQRATIRFMVGDYEGSLADIDRVLPLEPKHFGALSGEALILMQLGRTDEAQAVLKQRRQDQPVPGRARAAQARAGGRISSRRRTAARRPSSARGDGCGRDAAQSFPCG